MARQLPAVFLPKLSRGVCGRVAPPDPRNWSGNACWAWPSANLATAQWPRIRISQATTNVKIAPSVRAGDHLPSKKQAARPSVL
jgi:hypothetical protein